jgi:hypothetical protein
MDPQPVKEPVTVKSRGFRAIWGMRKATFFLLVIIVVLVLVAAIGGGVPGSRAVRDAQDSVSKSVSNGTSAVFSSQFSAIKAVKIPC